MKITDEQKQILDSIGKYKTIKINAFAGTGKTTTLRLIADSYRDKKILYLAFNSAIKNEASQIFPQNVFVKTTHGLAYSAVSRYSTIKLDKIVNYRAADISKKFDITYNQALTSLKIFESFCNNTRYEIGENDLEHKTAKKIFDLMLLGKMLPTHGFYLKYYYLMLKNEQINSFNYDIILLDEAQDTNEVTLGIFQELKSKTKVLVGDIHQQIYSFRGSRNILEKIDANKSLYLSKSFRFNEKIAFYANSLLGNFKNEKVKIKTGSQKDKHRLSTKGFISRTNGTIISQIAKRIERKEPFVTVRDPGEIFNLTCEVFYFLENKKDKIVKNRFLKEFLSEGELEDYIEDVDDFELRSALKVAKEYKEEVFYFKDIASKFYKAWNNRRSNGFINRIEEIMFLSTAHTAKGLEWDHVEIADDFMDLVDIISKFGCSSLEEFKQKQKTVQTHELLDEVNLFYVALTRAKYYITRSSENFIYLTHKDLEKFINGKIKDKCAEN